jgi:hypothetical protein
MYVYTKLLLYSPNNHQGVNDLMDQLALAYPQIEIRGKKTSDDLETEYQANLFNTWGALEFELNDNQLTTGELITSTTSASSVSYKLRICPSVMVRSSFPLPPASHARRPSPRRPCLIPLVMKMCTAMLLPQQMLGSTLATSPFKISLRPISPHNTQESPTTSL